MQLLSKHCDTHTGLQGVHLKHPLHPFLHHSHHAPDLEKMKKLRAQWQKHYIILALITKFTMFGNALPSLGEFWCSCLSLSILRRSSAFFNCNLSTRWERLVISLSLLCCCCNSSYIHKIIQFVQIDLLA